MKIGTGPERVRDPINICKDGNVQRLRKLLLTSSQHLDLNEMLRTCSKCGHSNLVHVLLQHTADPNDVDMDGRSALHHASLSGSIPTVLVLLENGADQTIKDRASANPYELAVTVGNHNIASIIINWNSPWDRILDRRKNTNYVADAGDQDTRSIATLERLLAQKEQVFGTTHHGLIATLERLADAYMLQDDFDRAVSFQERASDIFLKTKDENGASTDQESEMMNYFKLGKTYLKSRRLEKATKTFKKALACAPKAESVPRIEICKHETFQSKLANERRVLEHLALCLQAQQKYTEAEECLHRILEMIEVETTDTNHPLKVHTLSVLASCQSMRGDHRAAIETLTRALSTADKHIGPYHRDLAKCLDNLAMEFCAISQYHKAEALYRRSLEIRERVCDPEKEQAIIQTSHKHIAIAVVERGKASRRRPTKK